MSSRCLVPFTDAKGKTHSHYFIDALTQIIYYRKSFRGRRIQFSTWINASQFTKAKAFAEDEYLRRTGEGPGRASARSFIKEELDAWLLVKAEENLAYDTLNNVRRAAKQIKEYWGSRFPHEITKDEMPKWFKWWRETYSDIEMENAVKYMRNFSRYLNQKLDAGGRSLLAVVPEIPMPRAKEIRIARKKKKERILSPDDLKRILETANSDADRLVVLWMYTMASRITETLSLRMGEEVIVKGGEYVYRWQEGQNKADLEGEHFVHEACLPLLKAQIKAVQALGTNRLFHQAGDLSAALKSQQIDWDAWRDRANIDFHWTPHTFRHTCLTNLTNDPKNPQALIIKLYRVSLAVLIESYFHATADGRNLMRSAVKVEL